MVMMSRCRSVTSPVFVCLCASLETRLKAKERRGTSEKETKKKKVVFLEREVI
ncbi:hypothetical protein ASPCADRAFT_208371, partial [Aspergillus carbonarius ITEM 5010]